MTTVFTAGIDGFLGFQLAEDGTCCNFSPFFCVVLCVTHFGHTKKMKLFMTLAYEIYKGEISKPTVNQKVFKLNLCFYGTFYHFNEFFSFVHEIFLFPLCCLRLLISFAAIAFFPFCSRKALFPALCFTHFSMKGCIKHELRTAIAPTEHQSFVS